MTSALAGAVGVAMLFGRNSRCGWASKMARRPGRDPAGPKPKSRAPGLRKIGKGPVGQTASPGRDPGAGLIGPVRRPEWIKAERSIAQDAARPASPRRTPGRPTQGGTVPSNESS